MPVLPLLIKYWKPLAVAVLLASTFYAGMYVEDKREKAKDLAERNQYITAYEAEAQRSYKLAQDLAKTKKERDEYYRKLRNQTPTIIERPIYLDQCIDDDGRMLLNDYLRGQIPSTSGSHGTMPPADPVGGEHR